MSRPVREPLADSEPAGAGAPAARPRKVPSQEGEPRGHQRLSPWAEGVLVALVVVVGGGAFYWPALRCGVLSDGWHLLYIGSRPLGEAVLTRLDYHFSPVAHLLDGLLWRAFGMRDTAYQLENLASLGVLAGALHALSRRLFRERGIALVALVLFLANASYYEVPLWPVVGNFQSFAALLYVAALALAIRSGRAPRSWRWAAAFGLCALAAFFTYEPTLSVVPVGVLAAMLANAEGARRAPAREWRRALPAAAAGAAVLATAVLVKAALAAAGDRALFLPRDLDTVRLRVLFLLRALGAVFALRSADRLPSRALDRTARLSLGEPWFDAVAAALLLAVVAAGALLVWKGRPAVRLATLWLGIHVLLLATATTPESRHNLIVALPAAMLSSALLWGLARRLARQSWLPPAARRYVAPAIPLIAVALLLPGARRDLGLAADLYAEGTAATRRLRRLVEERLAEPPALRSVALVNLPAKVHDHGLGSYWFINGAHFLVDLASGGEVPHHRVELLRTRGAPPRRMLANGTRTVSRRALERRVADPARLVLAFEPRRRTVLRLEPGGPRPQGIGERGARRQGGRE